MLDRVIVGSASIATISAREYSGAASRSLLMFCTCFSREAIRPRQLAIRVKTRPGEAEEKEPSVGKALSKISLRRHGIAGTETDRAASSFILDFVVGVRGFEPRASWSQTKRSDLTELHPGSQRTKVYTPASEAP